MEMEDVLFEMTKNHLESGMDGVPIGYCTSSYMNPEKGELFYRGRSVLECSKWAPERVLYLLHHGKEGSLEQVGSFGDALKERGHCSQALIRQIERFPRHGSPMKLFATAALFLGMLEGVCDYREDTLNLIAKLPHLVASLINYHAGWGETPLPDESLGYIENFAHMLQAPGIDQENFSKVLTLFNILYYDHGGGSLSTFVGKVVASGLEDLYGSISASLCSLSGKKHGKGLLDAAIFLEMILSELGENCKESELEEFLKSYLLKHDTLPGFERGALRAEDVRARLFYEYASKTFPSHPMVKVAELMRSQGPKVVKNGFFNPDGIASALLVATGFDRFEYFPLLFAMARLVGISTQIVYERIEAKEGKGVPIMRPFYLYNPGD